MPLSDELRQRLDGIKTPEDVMSDNAVWAEEHPMAAFSEYLKFDKVIARTMRRASDADKADFVSAICDYLLDGIIPDYDQMPAIAAAMSEHAIEGHKNALCKVYVDRYKQYISGKSCGRGSGQRST